MISFSLDFSSSFPLTVGSFHILRAQKAVVKEPEGFMKDGYQLLKADLKRAGLSLRGISRELGVSHTAVVDVARGARRSRRIEHAILSALGFKSTQSWPPDQYFRKEDAQ